MYVDKNLGFSLPSFSDVVNRAKSVAKKVGPLDPFTRVAQRHYGRTKEERRNKFFKGMRHFAKLQPETKKGQRIQRLFDPTSKVLDEISNTFHKTTPESFSRYQRWISPAGWLHRKGGPLHRGLHKGRKAVGVPVRTPAQTTEILSSFPVTNTLSPQYETYPASNVYAEPFTYPGLPDSATFYEPGGDGDASPKSGGETVATDSAKKPINPAVKWAGIALLAKLLLF